MRTLRLHVRPRKRQAKSTDQILRPGSSFCRCAAGCGEYFKSERAFNLHREGEYDIPGDRRCAPTPRMREKGLERDSRGYWRLPKREFAADRRHQLEAAA